MTENTVYDNIKSIIRKHNISSDNLNKIFKEIEIEREFKKTPKAKMFLQLKKDILRMEDSTDFFEFHLADNIDLKCYLEYETDFDGNGNLRGFTNHSYANLLLHNNGKNMKSDIDEKIAIKFVKSYVDQIDLCGDEEVLCKKHKKFEEFKKSFEDMCKGFNKACKENKLSPKYVWDAVGY